MEKIRVMVLDDEQAITSLTRAVLTMHGYEVTEFNDPAEALAAARARKFDLFLVDILMPGMTGVEFLAETRKTEMNGKSKFAILSAKRMNEDERREVFDLGAELMTKPFMPQKLVEKVNELLG